MLEKEKLILSGEIIINKYDILDQSKEKFNLFEILDLEKREVDLHSKFIYELINPKGKNPLNKLFLSLFFENVLERKIDGNEIYSIYREYETGKYGRIDFYIKFENSNYGFAIEMKIDAGDQEKQLERYESFLKEKHGENYILYYLTLTGKEASELSTGFNTKYSQRSFKENIVKWLEMCLEKSYNYPILRENLKQYLNSVNKITNNLEGDKEVELMDLLRKGKNLRIVSEMNGVAEKLRDEIENEFWEELRKKIKEELDIEDEYDYTEFEEYSNAKEIYFYKDINLKDSILSFGIGRASDKIYYFNGIQETKSENGEWITKECIQKNSLLADKLIKTCSKFGKSDGAYWEYISEFQFKTDDLYDLIEDEKKDEKKLLVNSLVDTFKRKYQILEEEF